MPFAQQKKSWFQKDSRRLRKEKWPRSQKVLNFKVGVANVERSRKLRDQVIYTGRIIMKIFFFKF